ncbi:MAG: Holliday junction branch migration protein RuvA, partial [Sphingomonadales bacterium]
ALVAGSALAAALHLRDEEGGFNEAAVRAALPGAPLVGLTWAWREQGLITPPGNPAGLAAIADLARPGLRVIGRQPRAGSHVALVGLLSDAGVVLRHVNFLPEPALAEDEVAAAVLRGAADVGFGIRAEAERDAFRLLTTVQGVGGRVGLAILTVLAPAELAHAVAAGDTASIARANGVGPKLASRIAMELRSKFGSIATASGTSLPVGAANSTVADAIAALTALGFRPLDASRAVAEAQGELGADVALNDLVRLALKKSAR